jgi:hypothetical protein
LTIFVNHWKSRWGGVRKTAPLRIEQAKTLRGAIDRLLSADPDAAVMAIGDFNTDFDGEPLVKHAGVSHEPVSTSGAPDTVKMFNLHAELSSGERGTFYYRRGDTWNSFDCMAVSRGMLAADGSACWMVKPGSYEVLRLPATMRGDGTPKSFRRYKDRASGRWYYRHGYSDHFPVRVILVSRR